MNAETILKATKPGDIFSNDISKIKYEYKALIKEWHPDTNKSPIASDVFLKITELYNQALNLIDENKWEKNNYISFSSEDGKTICINYQAMYPFELGITYICKKHVIYIFEHDKEKYFRNAIKQLESIKFADMKMQEKFEKVIPTIISKKELTDGRFCLVLFKTEDVYPLKLVLNNYFKGKIPPNHVAWISSRLHNIECLLQYNNIAFNGINIDNCFISPFYHSIMLMGGWWYAAPINSSLIGTTGDIYKVMPLKAKNEKISITQTDLESIKYVLRVLSGSENTRIILSNKEIPSAMAQFMANGSGDNAMEEFHKWDDALTKSFGARRFIKLDIDEKDVYN